MKKLVLILLLCTGIISAHAQRTLNGVYAGLQVSLSPIMGGGMSRTDYVILFRPDGTLNDRMDKPQWQTAVTAHYEITGSKLTITYPKGSKDKYTITKDGLLDGGGYTLCKLDGSRIPKGYYKFSNASSSGGMGTGMVFVGVAHDAGLNFDGKGNFTSSKSSGTAVIGDNVGGGTSKKGGGAGTYKINNGQLTLTFTDGHVEQHTFFCRIQDKKPMAAIDGDLYFMDDDDKPTKNTASAKTSTHNSTGNVNQNNADNNTGNAAANDNDAVSAADGKTLLLKANQAHGGSKLDVVKTVRASATIMGLKAVSMMDVDAGKVRIELWKNGKLASVEQSSNGDSWQWINGRKSALAPARAAEMQSSLYSGIMGLRKPVLEQMQIQNIQKIKNNAGYSVMCKFNNDDYIFMLNNQSQLIAEGSKAGGHASVSVLTDLRPVQGIMIPFHEMISSGSQKLNVQYDDFEINPGFDTNSWAVPTGN